MQSRKKNDDRTAPVVASRPLLAASLDQAYGVMVVLRLTPENVAYARTLM